MKDQKRKKMIPAKKGNKHVKEIDPKHLQEQEKLFLEADLISPANKKIDRAEIIELNDGSFLNVDEYVSNTYTEKSTHFYKSFYNVIADLLGESRDVMKPFVKPVIVPKLKRKLIYGRFPNAIQKKIYSRNQYIGYYTRKYWNYQTLTKKGDLSLRDFIKDFEIEATQVLNNGGNLKDFIVEYCTKHRLPIQLELFNQ